MKSCEVCPAPAMGHVGYLVPDAGNSGKLLLEREVYLCNGCEAELERVASSRLRRGQALLLSEVLAEVTERRRESEDKIRRFHDAMIRLFERALRRPIRRESGDPVIRKIGDREAEGLPREDYDAYLTVQIADVLDGCTGGYPARFEELARRAARQPVRVARKVAGVLGTIQDCTGRFVKYGPWKPALTMTRLPQELLFTMTLKSVGVARDPRGG